MSQEGCGAGLSRQVEAPQVQKRPKTWVSSQPARPVELLGPGAGGRRECSRSKGIKRGGLSSSCKLGGSLRKEGATILWDGAWASQNPWVDGKRSGHHGPWWPLQVQSGAFWAPRGWAPAGRPKNPWSDKRMARGVRLPQPQDSVWGLSSCPSWNGGLWAGQPAH